MRVRRYELPPLADAPPFEVPGCHLERRRDPDGSVTTFVVRDDGERLGQVQVFVEGHGDPFYGRVSRTDDRHCYGAALEVSEAARGRGLARHLMAEARRTCFESGGRGMTGVVDPSNEPSMRLHVAIGCRFVEELRGVRVGPRVLWWSRRAIPA